MGWNATGKYDLQRWESSGVLPQYNGRIFDANTGLHDYGARMYWPEIGRFISVDTAGPSAAVPATFNRYAYVLNNPYKYNDPNGRWPEGIHNAIIDEAFTGLLTLEQRQILKDASAYVDRWTSIFSGSNHEHAMRSSDEGPAVAGAAIDARISGMSAYARMLQGTTPGSSAGINPEALNIFGQGGHTVMDRTSPAHTDPNGDPRPWKITRYSEHNAEESTISPEQRAAAVKVLSEYFRSTFGSITLDMATAGPDIFIQPDAGSSDIFIQP